MENCDGGCLRAVEKYVLYSSYLHVPKYRTGIYILHNYTGSLDKKILHFF